MMVFTMYYVYYNQTWLYEVMGSLNELLGYVWALTTGESLPSECFICFQEPIASTNGIGINYCFCIGWVFGWYEVDMLVFTFN